MLSILIPCYRTNFSTLIKALLDECKTLSVPIEILIGDDGNDEIWQKENSTWFSDDTITHIRSDRNLGRAGIRNLLADHAKFMYLLFLDADILPLKSNFLQEYLDSKDDSDVICGGRLYHSHPPQKRYQFHWHYGRHREQQTVTQRTKNGWKGFQTNNFLIKKSVFNQIKFNDQIRFYGHEDTLFGYLCFKSGFTILHINNPAIHIGLDDHKSFQQKIKLSVQTLVGLNFQTDIYIEKHNSDNYNKSDFIQFTKLSRYASKLQQCKIQALIRYAYLLLFPLFFVNFKLYRPNLFLIDIYKLGYYFYYMNQLKTGKSTYK
jgi:glycosyltransferase involved in cell wall biosynthesis